MSEIRTIQVLNTSGVKIRVWAVVVGNIGIHPTLASPTERKFKHGLYTLSHVPSGAGLAYRFVSVPKEDVPRLLDNALSYRWRGVRLVDMPTCEIVTCAEQMMMDMHGRQLDIKEQSDIRGIAVANNCGDSGTSDPVISGSA